MRLDMKNGAHFGGGCMNLQVIEFASNGFWQ